MTAHVKIDDHLIREAQRLGEHRTKKAAVAAALAEYIERRRQRELIGLFGQIDFDPAYDYKLDRSRR